jgi:adenylylsulfate kinase
MRATLVDSDEVRAAITPEPRYTAEERALFYRALAYVAARLAQEGVIPVVAATTHEAAYRRWARELCPDVFLVYARCPPTVCEARDPKGLYHQARADAGTTLPGIGVPYEEPTDADYTIDTKDPLSHSQVCALVDAFVASTIADTRAI